MGVSSGTMNRYNLVLPALLALAAGQSQYQSSGGFGGSSSGGFGGFGGGSGGYEGASDAAGGAGSPEETIPGVPGDDYPIFAEVPETSFLCDGQVDGGYYADPEAECQAFHICAGDGTGGLTKYSFLCPNGTLFQQQYFVCDWWFNVDCSTAEDFWSLNEEIAAERQANSPAGAGGAQYGGGQGEQGEEQEVAEGLKVLLLLHEGHMRLFQEALEQTQDTELLAGLGEHLEDMQGMLGRLY